MTTRVEVTVHPLFEEQLHSSGKTIKVVIHQMRSKTEARSIFYYRPLSPHIESRCGGDEDHCDDDCMLENGYAKRCKMCMAVTQLKYLVSDVCPDCDGRAELDGVDPYEKA